MINLHGEKSSASSYHEKVLREWLELMSHRFGRPLGMHNDDDDRIIKQQTMYLAWRTISLFGLRHLEWLCRSFLKGKQTSDDRECQSKDIPTEQSIVLSITLDIILLERVVTQWTTMCSVDRF